MEFTEEQLEFLRKEIDQQVRSIIGRVIGDIPTNDQIEQRLSAYLKSAEDAMDLRLKRQATHVHEIVNGMDASLRRAELSVNLIHEVHGHMEGLRQRDQDQTRALNALGTLPERVSRLEMAQTALTEAIYGDPNHRQAKPGFVNIMLRDMEHRNAERKELMEEISKIYARLDTIQAIITRWQGFGSMAIGAVKMITSTIWGRVAIGLLGTLFAALAGADFVSKLAEFVGQMFQLTP